MRDRERPHPSPHLLQTLSNKRRKSDISNARLKYNSAVKIGKLQCKRYCLFGKFLCKKAFRIVYTILDSSCAGTKTLLIGLLLKHTNSDFGFVSLTKRSCASPILKVDSLYLSNRFLCHSLPDRFSCRYEKLHGITV